MDAPQYTVSMTIAQMLKAREGLQILQWLSPLSNYRDSIQTLTAAIDEARQKESKVLEPN
jgi:hypothetical protein